MSKKVRITNTITMDIDTDDTGEIGELHGKWWIRLFECFDDAGKIPGYAFPDDLKIEHVGFEEIEDD